MKWKRTGNINSCTYAGIVDGCFYNLKKKDFSFSSKDLRLKPKFGWIWDK